MKLFFRNFNVHPYYVNLRAFKGVAFNWTTYGISVLLWKWEFGIIWDDDCFGPA